MARLEWRNEPKRSRQVASGEQLANLDLAAALAAVGGDEDLLREIAGIFLDECPSALSLIRRAAESADAAALERSAHSLKGSVSPFAAKSAHEAVCKLERIGRTGDLHGVAEALLELESALREITPELSRLAAS